MLNDNILKHNNVLHSCYIILLFSFAIRLFSLGIFRSENIYITLLLPSLLMLISVFVYLINKKVSYTVLIAFIFMFAFVLIQAEVYRLTFLMLFVIMFIIKDCNLSFVINVILLVSILSVFAIIILVSTGIIENEVFPYQDRYVFALGFANPNTAPLFISTILVLAAYSINLSKNKMLLLPFIIFASFGVYPLFIATGTRAFFAVWILFCLTIFFKKIFINRLTIKILRWFPIIALVSFYIMAMNYNSIVGSIDSILSYRIRVFEEYLSYFSLQDKIFGNAQITPTTEGRWAIANSYNVIFLSNGLIIFLIFFHFYRKSIDYYFYIKDYFSLSVLIFFVVYGLVEALLIGITFFPNILFWILLSRAKPIPKTIRSEKYIPNEIGYKHSGLEILPQN